MMQEGLHIGLAAWINAQRNSGSFAVYPAQPIVTMLMPEIVQNVRDLAQLEEFSRLVNFIPRQGQVAEAFSGSAVLWQIHRDILEQMDFASEPWTTGEQAEYDAARDILYTTDAFPSQKHLLYLEMRNAYEDVIKSDGGQDAINEVLSNWVVRGHKTLIEDALEVISRLATRSSRIQAQNEALSLSEAPPGVAFHYVDDRHYAPVHFAPISAIDRATWMEAKVSFADLDRAVGNNPPNDRWKAYLANRDGEVLFDYIALSCIRPWYTPALYEADDWRLTANDTVVSTGNGTEGLLPAYVDAVYLVCVKNVTTKPTTPPKPRLTRDLSGIARPIVATLSKSPGGTGLSVGVAKRVMSMTRRPAATSSKTLPHKPLRGVAASTAVTERFTALNLGHVRRVTAIDLNRRYMVVEAYLDGMALTPSEETTTTTIYVAGFGCQKIPFAPNPNVNYRW